MPKEKKRRQRTTAGQKVSDVVRKQELAKLNALRSAIVGDGDPTMASCPVDVMTARGMLSWEHQSACEWFLRLYRYRNNASMPRGTLDDRIYHSDDRKENERRDIEWFALLARCGISARDMETIVNLVVFQVFPQWLVRVISGQAAASLDAADRSRVIASLTRIKDVWLEFGRCSDDRLRAMSAQGRAQLKRIN